ncbi:5115_t:CDS:2 [Acaulospora colombiana]|uniref:5115_t:CDS:1 n=1 Tax=Acaulospora colombiana TaxID=27376 RepID=A0ACA9LT25_9GLOM|nr:5115_t:CDS:2 [Acaulospora colombiana]
MVSPSGLWGIFGGIQNNVYLARRYVKDHWFALLVLTLIDVAKITLSLMSREQMVKNCVGSDVTDGHIENCENVADFDTRAGIVIFGAQEVIMIALGLITILSVKRIEVKPKEERKSSTGPTGQQSHDNLLDGLESSQFPEENPPPQPFVQRASQLPGKNRPLSHRISQIPGENQPPRPFTRRMSQIPGENRPPQPFIHRMSQLPGGNHPPQPFAHRMSQLPPQPSVRSASQFPEVFDQRYVKLPQLQRNSTSYNVVHASKFHHGDVNRPQSVRTSAYIHQQNSRLHPQRIQMHQRGSQHLISTDPRMYRHSANPPFPLYRPIPQRPQQQQQGHHQNQKSLNRRSRSQPQLRPSQPSSDDPSPAASRVMASEPRKHDKRPSLRYSISLPDIRNAYAMTDKGNNSNRRQLSQNITGHA